MMWGMMEQRVYQRRMNTVAELKECFIAVWSYSDRTLLILQLTSRESVSKHVSMQMVDI